MKIVLTPLALLVFTVAAAQEDAEISERMSCTSIMVGRNASTDGSVMTSHTCDGRYRTWMQWVEAADHKDDAKLKIYQGRMHTETPQGMEGVTVDSVSHEAANAVVETAAPVAEDAFRAAIADAGYELTGIKA